MKSRKYGPGKAYTRRQVWKNNMKLRNIRWRLGMLIGGFDYAGRDS